MAFRVPKEELAALWLLKYAFKYHIPIYHLPSTSYTIYHIISDAACVCLRSSDGEAFIFRTRVCEFLWGAVENWNCALIYGTLLGTLALIAVTPHCLVHDYNNDCHFYRPAAPLAAKINCLLAAWLENRFTSTFESFLTESFCVPFSLGQRMNANEVGPQFLIKYIGEQSVYLIFWANTRGSRSFNGWQLLP